VTMFRRGIAFVLRTAGLLAAAALLAAPCVGDGAAAPVVHPAAPAAPAAGAERFTIDPTASTVAYRVGETALSQNRFRVAVGVTSAIRGEISVDPAHPRAAQIGAVTVDISQFRSDSARRDSAIRTRWLESERYPTAAFAPTAIEGLPEAYGDGRVVPVRIAGLLTMRTVTQPVIFTGTVVVEGAVLTSTLHTTIRMTDYGFEPPSLLAIFRVDDDVLIELHVTARRAG
jgi:polyisoprenoid-binding protein YceI